MRIQPPSNGEDYYLIQETSKSLVNRFEEGSKIVKMCLIVFGSIGVVIGAYAGWKYYKKWSIHRSAQRTRETLRDIIRDRDDSTQNNGVFSRDFSLQTISSSRQPILVNATISRYFLLFKLMKFFSLVVQYDLKIC